MNEDDDHPPTGLVRAPQLLSVVDHLARRGLHLIQNRSEGGVLCQLWVTVSGTIRECDDNFAGTLGFEKREIIGASVSQLYVRPVQFDELNSMLHDVEWSVPQEIRSPDLMTVQFLSSLQNIEQEFRHRDGSSVWLIQNLYLIRAGGEGGEINLWSISLDISELKRQEEPQRLTAAMQRLAELNLTFRAAFFSSGSRGNGE